MQFGQDVRGRWARFPRIGPIRFTLGVGVVLGFLMAFVGIFLFPALSGRTLRSIWLTVLASGALVLVGRAVFLRWRIREILFRPDGEVLLPRRVTFRASEAIDWTVEEERAGKASHSHFRIHLILGDTTGGTRREPLPALDSREDVYRLCDWFIGSGLVAVQPVATRTN